MVKFTLRRPAKGAERRIFFTKPLRRSATQKLGSESRIADLGVPTMNRVASSQKYLPYPFKSYHWSPSPYRMPPRYRCSLGPPTFASSFCENKSIIPIYRNLPYLQSVPGFCSVWISSRFSMFLASFQARICRKSINKFVNDEPIDSYRTSTISGQKWSILRGTVEASASWSVLRRGKHSSSTWISDVIITKLAKNNYSIPIRKALC